MLFLTFSVQNKAQDKKRIDGISLLDSVKTIYGDSCEIGVNSSLIERLYHYKNLELVSNYLNQYQKIKNIILNFRKNYIDTIEKDPALLLDVDRIFRNKNLDNIINACGIYFGPDSVTNLVVSYTIVRSSVKNYYFKLIQLVNFDKTFKKELSTNGKDWFYSEKLAEIKNTPSPIIKLSK
jgi:hypothetical protein